MEQLWHKTPTGDFLLTNIEALTLELGIFGSIFSPSASLALTGACAPHAWLIATIAYAIDKDIGLDLNLQWLAPARAGDVSLMSSFSQQGYKKMDLQHLNRVRLWYRINALTDICSADGREVYI